MRFAKKRLFSAKSVFFFFFFFFISSNLDLDCCDP